MRTRTNGFSLVELVVAITIGGIILTGVMGSFLTLSKMRQQLDLTRQIQREINFATIRIADRIRSQSVDYFLWDENNHYTLPIGTEDEVFDFNETGHMLTMNGAPLFSPNLMVRNLNFSVFPETEDNDIQPSVQLELIVSERAVTPKISVPLRTTISSRLIQ